MILCQAASVRYICKTSPSCNEENEDIVESAEQNNQEYIDPKKDRRNPVPVETSIKYLTSDGSKNSSLPFVNSPNYKNLFHYN